MAFAENALEEAFPRHEGVKISVDQMRVLKDALGSGKWDALKALSDGELYQFVRVEPGSGLSQLTRTIDLVRRGVRRPDTIGPELWPPLEDADIPQAALDAVEENTREAEVF